MFIYIYIYIQSPVEDIFPKVSNFQVGLLKVETDSTTTQMLNCLTAHSER